MNPNTGKQLPPGKGGKLGKHRGVILFGAAAAGVGVLALMHRKTASSSGAAGTPGATVLRTYATGPNGSSTAEFDSQLTALQNMLLRQERQITGLEKRKKKRKKKKHRGGPSGGRRPTAGGQLAPGGTWHRNPPPSGVSSRLRLPRKQGAA